MKHTTWIGCDPAVSAPVIRRTFTAKDAVSAEIDICGLGFFELRLNGKKIGKDLLVPAITDYCERDLSRMYYPIYDKLSHRALYLTYDLTDTLEHGENVLEIHLGSGWLRQHERTGEGDTTFSDTLRAVYELRLTYKDGAETCLCSDGTEQYRSSIITQNNLYLGEIWDYRLPCEDWRPVELLDFSTPLCKQTCPPDRVIRTLTPIFLGKVGGKSVYDAGENISGLVEITARLPAGEKLTLRFGEQLTPEGGVDFRTTGAGCTCVSGIPQIQEDVFISDGNEHTYCPKFVFHAFRYFEVEGEILSAKVLVIHSDVKICSEFTCSDETLNWLHEAFLRTQLNNMHCGIPSDCPHRERLGYTGDGQVCAETAMLLLDSKAFYQKWIDDILDCQCRNSGHVQHTAPMMGGGGGPGGWGSAIVIVPYRYFLRWGEKELLIKTYPAMQHWAEYMLNHSENGLVVREEKDGWCLGDWASLPKMELPEPFVNSCLFIKCLVMMDRIANFLGQPPLYGDTIGQIQTAIKSAYYDAATGLYCGGTQAANAFALEALGDKTLLTGLAAYYTARTELDTGFIGTDILIDMLCKHGKAALAMDLLTNENPGSFYTMKAAGSTTIWEYFDDRASLDHPMFGAAVRQLFQCILGIRQKSGSFGYKELIITPTFVENLSFARGKLQLEQGTVSVSWERKNGKIRLWVFVPAPAILILAGKENALPAGESYFEL